MRKQYVIITGQLIETRKQFIQQTEKFLGGALRCQNDETDIGEPGTKKINKRK